MASKTKAAQPPPCLPGAEQPAAKVAKTAKRKTASAAWYSADLRRVTEVMQAPAAQLPNKDVRSMLLEGLPHAVTPLSDLGEAAAAPESGSPVKRHAFQEEILALARKALGADEKAATGTRDAALEAVKQAAELLEGVQTDAKAAEATVQAAEAAIAAADAQVKAAYAECSEAEFGHAEAKHATKPAQEAKLKAEALNSAVTDIAKHFKALSEDVEEALKEAKRSEAASRVTNFLEDTKAEKCLVAAADTSLPRAVADRGRFDTHTVKSVGEVIEAKLREAEERLAAAAPAVDMADAFELGTWAVLDLAREQEAACVKTLSAARTSTKNAKQKESDAWECVKAQEDALAKLKKEEEVAAEKLTSVVAALEGLDRLVAGVSAPVPVEEAAPGAPVPDSPAGKSPKAAPSPMSVGKMSSPGNNTAAAASAVLRAVATPTRTTAAVA